MNTSQSTLLEDSVNGGALKRKHSDVDNSGAPASGRELGDNLAQPTGPKSDPEEPQVKAEVAENTQLPTKSPAFEHAVVVPARPPQLIYQGKTGICYDVRMRYHSRLNSSPSSYLDPHPEDPRRTFRIYKTIAEAGLLTDETLQGKTDLGDLMLKLPSREATYEELLLVHTPEHLEFITSTENMSIDALEHETTVGDSIYLNNDSFLAAKLSCGGAIEACRSVVDGRVKNSIAVIRPPGHHAEPENAGGFCLFSNVAVAAKTMLRDYPEKIRRIVVLDWDVHHGNGTQKVFYEDDRVLYISIHRYNGGKFYPGTTYGGPDRVGEGKGEGFNVNIPWNSTGMCDGDYLAAMYKVVMPICQEYKPDLVIISAGFDAAEGDPIGLCKVSPNGYAQMTHLMKGLADGRLVVCLEGGYNLDSVSVSALAVTKVLLGDPPGPPATETPSEAAIQDIDEVLYHQSRHWRNVGPKMVDMQTNPAFTREDSLEEGLATLTDVIRGYQARALGKRYGMTPLPLLRESKRVDLSPEQVLATPHIYSAKKIVVILHDPSDVYAHRNATTGMIHPSESMVVDGSQKYIEWATKQGFGILDVMVPRRANRPDDSYKDLIEAIWDESIMHFAAEDMLLVGIGQAYASVVFLAGHRNIRDICTGIVCFAGDVPLVALGSTVEDYIASWFFKTSLIFVSPSNKYFDGPPNVKRPRRKKMGRIVNSEISDGLYETVLAKFDESCEFLTSE